MGATTAPMADNDGLIPDYIRPGVRLLYESGSSSESDTPGKAGPAGVGIARYDVVAISGQSVYIQVASFLSGVNNPAAITFAGSMAARLDPAAIRGGGAPWMPVKLLHAFQPAHGIEVREEPFLLANQRFNAKVITITSTDAIEASQYDSNTGIQYTQLQATGRPRRGSAQSNRFNLKHQSHSKFLAYRKIELPWLNAPPPAWVATLQALEYQGNRTLSLPGSPPLSVPLRQRLSVSQRGADWIAGTINTSVQGSAAGSAPFISAQASIGGLWISPGVLGTLPQGVLDHDKTLGATLSFTRSSVGQTQTGVLTERGDLGGFIHHWVYRLNDGMLVALRAEDPGLNTVIDLSLTSIQ